ncbi:MAG: hypothetical protein IT191_00685 [Microbacteriaceae bacterium]|nr:hypothetical protein [Cryobacterium sp.]MBX3104643.1 hypothetical protein [Cryobacterium sp.]MCC6375515.1 hypothetical protein [Microbacteriaceae bacterium]
MLVGILIIIASIAGVFAVINFSDKSISILSTSKVLLPGDRIFEDDLVAVKVNLGSQTTNYLEAGSLPSDGLIVESKVSAGELIPKASVGLAASEKYATVVIEIEGQLPSAVTAGAVVDIWSSNESEDGYLPPEILVSNATVAKVIEGEGIISTKSEFVELLIPRDRIARLIEAKSNDSSISLIPASLPLD